MLSPLADGVQAAAADLAARIVLDNVTGRLPGVRCHVRVHKSRLLVTITDLPADAVTLVDGAAEPTASGARITQRIRALAASANRAARVTRPAVFVIPPSVAIRAANSLRRTA